MTSLTKICLHWTGGANMPCEQNLDCYHFLFDKNGKESSYKNIKTKENGELEDWPEGFFDQKRLDLRELLEMRRCKA